MGKKSKDSLHITAIILGAGFASRMGECKLLLPLGGKTALAQLVERLHLGGVSDICVVTGARGEIVAAEAKRLGCMAVHNPKYTEGMFTSICAGLSVLSRLTDGVLIMPGDIPLIKPQTIKRLIRTFEKNRVLVYPSFLKERGHPPVIGSALFNSILNFSEQGGLRSLLAAYEPRAKDVAVADRSILLDMDTPEDYIGLAEYLRWEYIPDRQECDALLALAGTPEAVIRHGRVVARVAIALASALKPYGFSFDMDCLRAACLLHDIAKTHRNHEALGARWLRKGGFGKVGALVAVHKDLPYSSILGEAELLYLADKLVEGERISPLEARLAHMKERFPQGSQGRENAKRRIARAQGILAQIEEITGKPFAVLLEEVVLSAH